MSAEEEHELIVRVLRLYGAEPEGAVLQATWLVEADLRNHSSHGIRRLPTLVGRMRRGLLLPTAEASFTWRSKSVLAVDGDRGFGPVVASKALERAIPRVRQSGVALVAISNANHLGILAPYVEILANAGLVGIALTTSEALVHPWGGRRAMLGTNPIAIGVPSEPHPVVVDMATGAISMGLVLHRAEVGQPLEPGWAVDAEGEPTVDPVVASNGSISPFGGPKGYGLGLVLELLVACLTGTALGNNVHGTLDTEQVCNKGDVFICMDPAFSAVHDISAEVNEYIQAIRNTPPQKGVEAVRVPGDRAQAERIRRRQRGVEIADAVWYEAMTLLEQT